MSVFANHRVQVRGGSQALKEDFTVPTFFERSPAWLANHVVSALVILARLPYVEIACLWRQLHASSTRLAG
eukprot:6180066-Pleurochrysis_carterae.AAC.2